MSRSARAGDGGRPHLAVLGPTAAWKSVTAIAVASQLNPAEIISVDSMQIYRGMAIGTAQPSAAELARIPHHLIGSLDIHNKYSVSEFCERAKSILRALEGRGAAGILTGGTGLYAKALIEGFLLHPACPELHTAIEEACKGPDGHRRLQAELEQHGPVPAAVTENPRRLVRAVEVLRLTGRPPWLAEEASDAPPFRFVTTIIIPENRLLWARIRARTRLMLDSGWIEEARALLDRGLMATPTARQALGYGDIERFLNGDLAERDELATTIAQRTVKFARRQLTWFRNQHRDAHILRVNTAEDAAQLPERILAVYRRHRAPPGT